LPEPPPLPSKQTKNNTEAEGKIEHASNQIKEILGDF
jgi:hypothetical protein